MRNAGALIPSNTLLLSRFHTLEGIIEHSYAYEKIKHCSARRAMLAGRLEQPGSLTKIKVAR